MFFLLAFCVNSVLAAVCGVAGFNQAPAASPLQMGRGACMEGRIRAPAFGLSPAPGTRRVFPHPLPHDKACR